MHFGAGARPAGAPTAWRPEGGRADQVQAERLANEEKTWNQAPKGSWICEIEKWGASARLDGNRRSVLERVDSACMKGEIIGIAGPVRALASRPCCASWRTGTGDHGEVMYRQQPLYVARRGGISMVFPVFRPLPWLTVQQNVELGLEAQGRRVRGA